jgi:antitoxin component HigA of HigAB toxin-antitoxin module
MSINTKNRKFSRLPGTFTELVRLMPPMAIRDDVQHGNVVAMIDRLMQIDPLSRGQSDYMETLVELVETYEKKRHALDVSDVNGTEMLKHVLGESNMSGSDLARLLGIHPTMGSKILSGQRRLTWEHAKTLASHFKLSPALFMD